MPWGWHVHRTPMMGGFDLLQAIRPPTRQGGAPYPNGIAHMRRGHTAFNTLRGVAQGTGFGRGYITVRNGQLHILKPCVTRGTHKIIHGHELSSFTYLYLDLSPKRNIVATARTVFVMGDAQAVGTRHLSPCGEDGICHMRFGRYDDIW